MFRMFGLLRSLSAAARLYVMRRRQHESTALRREFSEKYDIEVGLYSYGCFDSWRMPGPMRVGRYCSIAGTVRSARLNHPTDALTTYPALYKKSFGLVDSDAKNIVPLVIEDDVWIGHNVIILPGCNHIGRGAVVGAGSILTRDVPAYAIVGGNPAKKLRDRFDPPLAAAIDASGWWRLDLAELKQLAIDQPGLIFHPSVEGFAKWRGAS
jgi:acetyltransferase-like isoleucine patch superfamily enzyme